MPFTLHRKPIFKKDLQGLSAGNSELHDRVERRIVKIGENPKHHGYHAGGEIRCNWVAGVGNFAIIYEVIESDLAVRLLRLVSLDDL